MLVKPELAKGTPERQSFSNQWVWTYLKCLLQFLRTHATLYLNQM